MNEQPMFRPNGDGYDISPAGLLMICAGTVYGDHSETTPQGVTNALTVMDRILSAARAGGFAQCDILRTMLARNDPTPPRYGHGSGCMQRGER